MQKKTLTCIKINKKTKGIAYYQQKLIVHNKNILSTKTNPIQIYKLIKINNNKIKIKTNNKATH